MEVRKEGGRGVEGGEDGGEWRGKEPKEFQTIEDQQNMFMLEI